MLRFFRFLQAGLFLPNVAGTPQYRSRIVVVRWEEEEEEEEEEEREEREEREGRRGEEGEDGWMDGWVGGWSRSEPHLVSQNGMTCILITLLLSVKRITHSSWRLGASGRRRRPTFTQSEESSRDFLSVICWS